MKIKRFVSIALSVMLTLSIMSGVTAEQDGGITVIINGNAVDFTNYDNALPYIENDITLVPIRVIAEGLGFDVSWNESKSTVGVNGRSEILLTVNSDTAYVNGEAVALDVLARLTGERTFVPLRFVSENLGAVVIWDESTRTINITPTCSRLRFSASSL